MHICATAGRDYCLDLITAVQWTHTVWHLRGDGLCHSWGSIYFCLIHTKDLVLTKLHCLTFLREPKASRHCRCLGQNLGVEESLQPMWKAHTHPERVSGEMGTWWETWWETKWKANHWQSFMLRCLTSVVALTPLSERKTSGKVRGLREKQGLFNYHNEQNLHWIMSELMSCSNQFWLGNMGEDHQEDQINYSTGRSEVVWNHVVFPLYCSLDFGAAMDQNEA